MINVQNKIYIQIFQTVKKRKINISFFHNYFSLLKIENAENCKKMLVATKTSRNDVLSRKKTELMHFVAGSLISLSGQGSLILFNSNCMQIESTDIILSVMFRHGHMTWCHYWTNRKCHQNH
jgi:fructose-1-phosphate kinase PfkB-like protein